MSQRIIGSERLERIRSAMVGRMGLALAADVRQAAHAALTNAGGER